MEKLVSLLNEWWIDGKVKQAKEYKRSVFKDALELISEKYKQIIVVSGLRRVGKSILLFQLIEYLIKNNVEPRKIFYFSFDERVEDLFELLNTYSTITKFDWRKENVYLFFDEIQKLKDWSSKIKLLYDNFPNLKIIVSGSASILIEKEALSNLAGRYFLIKMEPLSLKEFFELKRGRKIDNPDVWRSDVRLMFEDYLLKPLPEIVEWSEQFVREYIRSNVVEKVVRKDLPEIFKNVNSNLLLNLLEIFYSQPGLILNLDTLSSNLKVSKKTLIEHINYLENSYLIRIVKNLRGSFLITSRKLRKVYPYHWCLIYSLFNKDEIEAGRFYECVIASLFDAKYYWRESNKEIDFMIGKVPVEVKASRKIYDWDLKNLKYIMKKFSMKEGVLAYLGNDFEEVDGIKIIPLFDLCYNIRLSFK
ncbi:MAG: ATP-binding protein [Nitrososphaeria archaeon]